jgi:hypothetical protein
VDLDGSIRFPPEDDAMASKMEKQVAKDENLDPISGEPGAHPFGAGLGAAGGGAAAGALGGAVAGPIGAVVGAVVGGVAGGLAGKGVAESIDPTVEEAYWRKNYPSRPYASSKHTFEHYHPAYRYGWESRSLYDDQSWDEIEPSLREGWPSARGNSALEWEHARHAARDAWDHTGLTNRTTETSGI